jgi:hypothetical protein
VCVCVSSRARSLPLCDRVYVALCLCLSVSLAMHIYDTYYVGA